MADTATQPMITGAAAPALPLTEHGPVQPPLGEPLDGPMNHRGVVMWRSADGAAFTGLWECDAGRFRVAYGDDDVESIHVVSGRLIARHDDGSVTEVGPGDAMTFPPGWRGVWECPEPFRKFYAIFKAGRSDE